jgi:hypothetical protein
MIRGTTWLAICIVLVAIGSVSCGGGGADTPEGSSPTSDATRAVAPAAPEATDTTVPSEVPPPTATLTAQPTAAATDTPRPTDQVRLEWDPDGVRPSDSDDVDALVLELTRENEGIISGYGNEQSITIQYDTSMISVEELMDILDRMGHPVVETQ